MKRAELPDAGSWLWTCALASVSLALASASGTVHAHAGPQVRGIFWGSAQAPKMLLSNRGLIFAHSNGSDWRLMCNEALGVGTSELPSIVQMPDGRIVAASTVGLSESSDSGCTWKGIAPYEKQSSPSLAQDPKDPNRLYLATFGMGGESGLQLSKDGGHTWEPLMPAADTDYLGFIRIAPNMPERVYMRSLSFATSAFAYSTMRSNDAGKTWESSPYSLINMETDFVLLGVSPTDPDLIVAKAEAANPIQDPERLLVSHDAGKTFENPTSVHVISSVEWSSDGKTMWVGSDDGLFTSTDTGKTFTQVGDSAYVDCLDDHEGELLVGGYWRGVAAGRPGVGISSDGGKTLEQWMGLTDVVHPLECDPSSNTAKVCESLWTDWEREILGIYDTGAAGTSAGGAGASGTAAAAGGGSGSAAVGGGGAGGAGAAGSFGAAGTGAAPDAVSSGCSCEVPRGRGASSWIAGAWVVLLGAAFRIRRRRRLAGVARS